MSKGKKIIITCSALVLAFLATVCIIICRRISDTWNFGELYLEKVAISYFEPSAEIPSIGFFPRWQDIRTQEAADNFITRYGINLPEIDFETEMFIVSFGSELEYFRYVLSAPGGAEGRGVYNIHTSFRREIPDNIIIVYRTSRISGSLIG